MYIFGDLRIEEGEPCVCEGAPRAVSSAGFVSVADHLEISRTAP